VADGATRLTLAYESDLGASAAETVSPAGERPIDPGLESHLF
jgi:hypothetical protein